MLSPSIYSIAEFIEKINPKDENFFKYIPNSFLNKQQKLSKSIALTKREEDVVNATIQDKSQASPRLLSPSTYSIAEFIEKINPKDENFFKYIPNSFLNEEQKQAKAKALARELKISQKEKILPTVTPQDAFVDILKDPSINSIPEISEKVNTLDEKIQSP